jgi:AAA+ superfamily predicted ATPase
LVLSHVPGLQIQTHEEDLVYEVALGVAEELRIPLYVWSITEGLSQDKGKKSWPQSQEALKLLKAIEGMSSEGIFILKDFHRELEDRSILRFLKDLLIRFSKSRSIIILTGSEFQLPPDFEHLVLPFELRFPTEAEVGQILKSVIASLKRQFPLKVDLDQKALNHLLASLKGLSRNQVRQLVTQSLISEKALNQKVLQKVIENKIRLIRDGGLLEFFPVGEDEYQLGGFRELKLWLERSKMGFTEQAKALNLSPPKGMLLVGVPGCGKSLSARVVSQLWNLPLLKLDAGSLYNKYMGETEKNFREATKTAEAMSPCILWIDEIEKAFGSSDSGDGGVSQRLLGSFLSWMQEKKDSVFLLATANQIDKLPPELMRKGRFDEIFYVDLPTEEERQEIFQIHLQRRKQDLPSLNLKALATEAAGFSGAEIEQAVVAALYESLHSGSPLTMELLRREMQRTQPLSVSRAEEIGRLRSYIQGRFRPVQ